MGSVVVIQAPEPLVDFDTAKAHLRVDHSDDDTLIGAYVAAASAHIDGPGGWLNRAISPQTLELRLNDFAPADRGAIHIPFPPLIDVLSVKYLDDSGVEQTVAAEDYEITAGPVIRPVYDSGWPSARATADAVRVRYRAGYVDDPEAAPLVASIPAPIKAAVLLMLGDLYQRRETTSDGSVAAVPMAMTVENLLAPYRAWRF